MDNDLSSAPNIGKTLAEKLVQCGITDIRTLKSIGSENAFARLKTIDETACINMLYALEGAVQDIRWHSLSKERKNELKEFYNISCLK